MYFVEYCLCLPLLPQPYERQTFENSTALEVRLLLEDLVGLLQSFLVVAIVQPVVDRPQPPLSHGVLGGVLSHVDQGQCEEDSEVGEDERQQEIV